jgi:hypothetical protein
MKIRILILGSVLITNCFSTVSAQEKLQLISKIAIPARYVQLENIASPQLKQTLTQLRTMGQQNGWTFQVAATGVAQMNLTDLTGAIPPDGASQASGQSQNKKCGRFDPLTCGYLHQTRSAAGCGRKNYY